MSPESASKDLESKHQNPTEDWLKSAIDHIHSEKKDSLETQPTIDKLEFQTTISRDQYQTSALPTDRILKRGTRDTDVRVSTHPNKSRFLYALTGLVFGIALSLTGLLFLIHGIFGVSAGASSWVAGLLGLNPNGTNDLIPGIAMIVLGLFVIFITKEKSPPT